GVPRTKLSTTTISSAPAVTSSSTMWDPISPAPPVTSARQPRSRTAASSHVDMLFSSRQPFGAQRGELALERLDSRQQVGGPQAERGANRTQHGRRRHAAAGVEFHVKDSKNAVASEDVGVPAVAAHLNYPARDPAGVGRRMIDYVRS